MIARIAILSAVAVGLAGAFAGVAPAQEWREEIVRYETEHPYPDGVRETVFVARQPGATEMRLFFERLEMERGWDFLELYDASGRRVERFTGRGAGFWSNPVPGDTIEVRLNTDGSGSEYGALVTRIAHRGGETPARLERLEVSLDGRALSPDDVVEISPRGDRDDEVVLDVRAFDRSGREVRDFRFEPRIDAASGARIPVAAERMWGNRVRLVALDETAREVPVRLYDAGNPDLAAKFLVTVRQPIGVRRIEVLHEGRPMGPGDVLTLSVRGSPGDEAILEIVGYDRYGERVRGFDFSPGVRTSALSLPVTIEQIDGRLRLLADRRPSRGDVSIEIFDTRRPRISTTFRVAVEMPRYETRIDDIRFRLPGGREADRIELEAGESLRFSVAALDSRGRRIDPRDARLEVGLDVVAWYGTLEEIEPGEYVFRAGAIPHPGIRITARDPREPANRETLVVSTRRGYGAPPPRDGYDERPPHVVHEIHFVIPEADGERRVGPGETVALAVHGRGPDHLPFRVVAIDHDGRPIPPEFARLEVALDAVAWYGNLERVGRDEYVFHSGALPHPGIRVIARSENRSVREVMRIAVQPTVADREHDHGHDDGHGHDPGRPHRPEDLHWAQIGATWPHPEWAKMPQAQEVEFLNSQNSHPVFQVKVIPRHQFQVDFVRVEYEDGTQRDLFTGQRTLAAGEEMVVEVPPDLRDKKLQKVRVKVRRVGYGELLAHVLTPR